LNVSKRQAVPPLAARTSLQRLEARSDALSGVRLYRKAMYRQASLEFERVLEEKPTDYRAAYLLGMSHLNRGRYEDARSAFRLALELGPDRKTAAHIHNGLAYSYEATRQTRMAHHHFHHACAFNRANGYSQAGAARTEYRDLAKQSPRPVARREATSKRRAG
jgi:Flp pilus assembly protein TadD